MSGTDSKVNLIKFFPLIVPSITLCEISNSAVERGHKTIFEIKEKFLFT